MKRIAISKKVRFEVFKRDGFRCQYCGKSAPDVVLYVDHISPVSKGGKNDLMNLITSCVDCNSGKGARELNDDTAIQRQKKQLEELNARREQLEMMLKWREGLASINESAIKAIADTWSRLVHPYVLNENGLTQARKLLRKFGLQAILEAMEVASEQYIKRDKDKKIISESVEKAWSKIGGIIALAEMPSWQKELYYIRGILRKRFSLYREWEVLRELENAAKAGVDVIHIKELAKTCNSYNSFEYQLALAVKETSQ